MATNNRTLDLDKLFVRDIVFKDASNRPIPANRVLTTRGDGGIYFSDIPPSTNSTFVRSFNEFRAGSNIVFPASNAYNKLWFEAGAGIQYFSNLEAGQQKLYIAATAPEQITIPGDKTLNFSSLTDSLDGGRTLYFAGTGDTTVNISGTTVLFGSVYNSSYSSLFLSPPPNAPKLQ